MFQFNVKVNMSTCNGSKTIIIGVIYRPSNTCIDKFTEILNDIQNKIQMENKLCYVLGHYNIHLLNAISTNHYLSSSRL